MCVPSGQITLVKISHSIKGPRPKIKHTRTSMVSGTNISGTGCALACTECTCTPGSAHGKRCTLNFEIFQECTLFLRVLQESAHFF